MIATKKSVVKTTLKNVLAKIVNTSKMSVKLGINGTAFRHTFSGSDSVSSAIDKFTVMTNLDRKCVLIYDDFAFTKMPASEDTTLDMLLNPRVVIKHLVCSGHPKK